MHQMNLLSYEVGTLYCLHVLTRRVAVRHVKCFTPCLAHSWHYINDSYKVVKLSVSYSYKVGDGVKCHSTNGSPNATPLSPLTMVSSCDVIPKLRGTGLYTNLAFIYIQHGLLLGCSCVCVHRRMRTLAGTSGHLPQRVVSTQV